MGKTLTFGKGKGNIRHNNRDYLTDNVDKSRLGDNVYLVKQDLMDAYKECFGQAIEDYNAGQRRADRKKSLAGYIDEIKKNQANRNGEKLFYEQIIALGDMHDSGVLTSPDEAEKCKGVLLDYFSEWQDRNPNLHVFNAVLHLDEATPHLHIDYIPVGRDYKQGLQARNSLTRAFENMGIDSAKDKKDNGTIRWQARERERITEIAKGYGIEIDYLGVKRQDYKISDYKALVRDEKKALAEKKEVKPKRVNLPFGLALELNRSEVDSELERRADLEKAEKTFILATEQAEETQERAKIGLKNILGLESRLEKEKAENDEYRQRHGYEEEIISELEWQNGQLKAQINDLQAQIDKIHQEYEKAIQEVVEEEVVERCREMARGREKRLSNFVEKKGLMSEFDELEKEYQKRQQEGLEY